MRKLAVCVVLMMVGALTGFATTITFTNRGDWNAAMFAIGSSMFTETFDDGLVNEPGLSVDSQWGGSISAFQFNDRVSSHSGQPVGPSGNPSPWVTTWSLSGGLTYRGFGGTFDLSPGGPGEGIDMWVDFGTGYELVLTVPRSAASEFHGFVSSLAFNNVQFRGGGDPLGIAETYRIDDVSYGGVPEPGTILLIGSGLVALGLLRRRR